jgi:leader peptidase (prepilin peptidase) / N-methyltransferase
LEHLIFIFLIGLCVGSFVNVCIYRLPKSKQVLLGRSYCPKCKKKIKWFDNIPVLSYFLLNRKCRSCKKKISSKYFIIELLIGIGFLLIFLNYQNYFASVLLSILLAIYVIIFFIDLKHFIIPDILNFGVMILALAKNFLPDLNLSFTQINTQSIIGGFIGYLSIWIIIYLYKTLKKMEAMGLGDAKLMAGIGLLFGWQSIPFVLFFAAILGLLVMAPSLLKSKRNLKSKIPFGPYIITAGIIYFFYGNILYKTVLGI